MLDFRNETASGYPAKEISQTHFGYSYYQEEPPTSGRHVATYGAVASLQSMEMTP